MRGPKTHARRLPFCLGTPHHRYTIQVTPTFEDGLAYRLRFGSEEPLKITALKISNYKGFSDSGFVRLSGSWNVVVGQNNAGKTAFIEGFRLSRNVPKPHRNESFKRGVPYPAKSRFTAKMQFSREWLKNAWLRMGGNFDLPVGGAGPQKEVARFLATAFRFH
jgi:hypothetical protein